jgi:arginyl-tRNA synthetase
MRPNIRHLCDPLKAELATRVAEVIAESFHMTDGLDLNNLFDLIETPPDTKMGDYAMPCFRFSKALKKKPQEIAEAIKIALESKNVPVLQEVRVIGAFLNFVTRKIRLAQDLLPAVHDGSYFDCIRKDSENLKTRVMIEYSQPNTHKEFHVGHGRNVCLGDSIRRIFEYNGFATIPANYIGDEGAHIAKCLWQMDNFKGDLPAENKSEWYGKRYVEANQRLDSADPEKKKEYLEQVSAVLRAIEEKSGRYYEIWRKSRLECLEDFKRIYDWLDVRFDHYFFESDFSDSSQKLVDSLLQAGFFHESDGAIGKDLSDYKLGFCMVRKSDGNIPYMARDIALAKQKFGDFAIDRSINVVGSEQIYHFQQLFKVLELMGFEQAKKCYHLSYGMVSRPDGKMSSRKGNSVTFSALKNQMLVELGQFLDRYRSEWSAAEIEDTAHKLSVGAIKYGMLHADPSKDIVFDLKDWLSFEGNTGPYLMYAYARTQSIITKAADQGLAPTAQALEDLTHESEFELLRFIYDFNNICYQACESYKPSVICHHLFSMCKAFNRFYSEVPVLKADTQEEKGARLLLISAFAKTLKVGLHLLGISPVERM